MTYSDIVDATCIFDVTSLQQKFNSKILTLPTKHYLQNTAKNKYKLKWTMTKKKTDKGECYVDDMPSVLKYYQLLYYPLFHKNILMASVSHRRTHPGKSGTIDDGISDLKEHINKRHLKIMTKTILDRHLYFGQRDKKKQHIDKRSCFCTICGIHVPNKENRDKKFKPSCEHHTR